MAAGVGCASKPKADYPVKDVPLTAVKFTDGFWAQRQQVDVAVTIAHEIKMSEETKRLANFELAAAALRGEKGGTFQTRFPFDDSDVYKVIEAAAYVLMLKPDPELEKKMDEWIAKIGAAQEPDGYLYTARTIDPANVPRMSGPERWVNLQDSHELYNVGHMYEAAVAYDQATGKKAFLNIALKSADFIARTFGPAEGQLKLVPGHEEIEIGLVKLYRATGKKTYLDLAKFFIDERGNAAGHKLYGTYAQDHKPVIEQDEAVGHSVRAGYLYAGATDVAALTGDPKYMEAMNRIWEDVVSKKLYLTGGVGAAGGIEGFGPAYDLPNATGYAETCATIAYALWNHRMFRYYGDGKYMDMFERAAYNAFLSGAGLSGDVFFYPNPLASYGQHERTPWFACACCPPNVARFIAEMGAFAYGVERDQVYVNLYAQGTADLSTAAGKVHLEQTTDYPWKGDVRIKVVPAKPSAFTLRVRIPGWAVGNPVPSDLYRYADKVAENPVVMVNGKAVPLNIEKGFLPITRTWQSGDAVEITLPMPVRRVIAHPAIKDNVGRTAVERGPLVYTAEFVDNNGYTSNLVLDDIAPLAAEWRTDPPAPMTVITGPGTAHRVQGGRTVAETQRVTFIPYFAWAYRGKGEMAVWIAREKGKARAIPEPTLASTSVAAASEGAKGLPAIHDLFEPADSNDHSHGYLHWWPKKGTVEWVEYAFGKPTTISETSVYWFDDTGQGECRVPASWKAFTKAGDRWVPVKAVGPFGVAKDASNTVRFAPVTTTGIRLEIQLPEKFSAGIQEWKVR
ncbi:MAG: glycoside hydrolase family 127 protein [Candidatus Aminicenantes bacterium]|nr:glycoside hydrolase family 127 protein [Candidatus Aminicenantes bacterium]